MTVWVGPNRQSLARLNASTVFVECRSSLTAWLQRRGLRLGAVLWPAPLSLGRHVNPDQSNSSLVFGRIWPLVPHDDSPDFTKASGRLVGINGNAPAVTEGEVRRILELLLTYLATGRVAEQPDITPSEEWQTILRARRLQPWISMALAWWDDPRVPTLPMRICLTFRATTDAEMARARGHDAVLFCGE